MTISAGLGVGSFLLASQLWQANQPMPAVIAGAAGLGLFGYAQRMWQVAASRRFGKTFEQDVTAKAEKRLQSAGMSFKSNVMMRGLGDIDIVVQAGDMRVPVEIKSFRKWNQGLFSFGEREQRAIDQACAQKAALNSTRALIWLPQGERTFWQWLFGAGAGRVHVVFGDEKRLVKVLKRLGC